jgi:hypothetical protein
MYLATIYCGVSYKQYHIIKIGNANLKHVRVTFPVLSVL